jgi:low temperature requirement protein LtrA
MMNAGGTSQGSSGVRVAAEGECRLRPGCTAEGARREVALVPPADEHPHLTNPEPEAPGMDWLEVFYDLIYGVAIIELTNLLDEQPTAAGLLRFVGLFLPIWWVWTGWTVYIARVEADDGVHRLLSFGQMFAIAVMAVQVRNHEAGSWIFALAFVGARLSLLAMYWRAGRRIPEMGPINRVYLRGFGLGALIWLVSVATPDPVRFWLWGIGLGVDFATPWLARAVLRTVPLDWTHLVERLGTFSSIVLSVAIAGVVLGMAGHRMSVPASVAAALSFSLAVCVWWVYSAFLERYDLSPILGSGQPYIYGHLPLVLGLSVMSAGVRRAIVVAGTGDGGPAAYWLIGGGCALWMLAMLQLRWLVAGRREPHIYVLYSVTLVVSVAVALTGPYLPTNVGLGVLVMVFGTALVIARRLRKDGPDRIRTREG